MDAQHRGAWAGTVRCPGTAGWPEPCDMTGGCPAVSDSVPAQRQRPVPITTTVAGPDAAPTQGSPAAVFAFFG